MIGELEPRWRGHFAAAMFIAVSARPDYGKLSGRQPSGSNRCRGRLNRRGIAEAHPFDFGLLGKVSNWSPVFHSLGARSADWHIECRRWCVRNGHTIDFLGGSDLNSFPP